MPITVACAQCGQKYRVKEHLAGKTARCKSCGQPMHIPALASEERSPAGSPIYRHKERTTDLAASETDEQLLECLGEHLAAHIGEVKMVFHEIISEVVHVDVHWIEPTPERDFHTLVTSGMSDRPMTVPDGAEEYQYAELLIALPSSWPLTQEAFEDEDNYWPVRWLKMLARMPHEYNTWLGMGHTVPNGDPPEPFAGNTKMCCWMMGPPVLVPEDFSPLVIGPEKQIHFYSMLPLYREEMELKLREGFEAIMERLGNAEVTELLDAGRKNVVKKKFWPF